MASSNEMSLGDAIREFMKEYRLDKKLNETKLINSWENVVGKMIANHTLRLNVYKGVLFVKLDSPALVHELNFARERICKSLNDEVGSKVIDNIKFT
jgi:predicted nucleic acid-binding Zn ribbon protein